MNVIKNEQIFCVDIDGTLLLKGKIKKKEPFVKLINPYSGEEQYIKIHSAHVKVLQSRLARGAHVLVWSANGYLWALATLKALNIEHKNITVLSKPVAHMDDKPATDWMGDRIYLQPDDMY